MSLVRRRVAEGLALARLGGRPVLVIGVMPAGAVGRIAVRGEIDQAQTVTGPEDAPLYYVLTLAGDAVPRAITFVAGDGTDLTTVPVAR